MSYVARVLKPDGALSPEALGTIFSASLAGMAIGGLFTAPADRPLVNLRHYTIALRRMGEVFDRLAMPVRIETLGPPIGFYTSTVGPLNQVVHL